MYQIIPTILIGDQTGDFIKLERSTGEIKLERIKLERSTGEIKLERIILERIKLERIELESSIIII